MGNSLRDELLKAGLVSEERPEKPRRTKRRKAGPGKKRQPAPVQADSEGAAATSAHVLRENRRRTARFVRDSTLAGGSVAENAKKALRRKIQELIKTERLNDAQAAIAYHFVRGKRIKRIYVTQDQRAQLTAGTMVVAALEGNNHLLTCSAAEQLLSLAPQTVVCGATEAVANEATSNEGQGEGQGEGEGEGEEHPVPDDIVW